MCDYSLQHLASRPAKVGDKLVSTKFTHSLTGGFCAVGEPNVAVCLLPGTELAFEREIECEAGFRILPPRKLGAKVARFRRVNEAQPSMHHDALELPGGCAKANARRSCNCPSANARIAQRARQQPRNRARPCPCSDVEQSQQQKGAIEYIRWPLFSGFGRRPTLHLNFHQRHLRHRAATVGRSATALGAGRPAPPLRRPALLSRFGKLLRLGRDRSVQVFEA
jgi:hypothetical protein